MGVTKLLAQTTYSCFSSTAAKHIFHELCQVGLPLNVCDREVVSKCLNRISRTAIEESVFIHSVL